LSSLFPITGLSTLPLNAVSSVLNALEADASDYVGPTGAQALDRAGYESVSSLSIPKGAVPLAYLIGNLRMEVKSRLRNL